MKEKIEKSKHTKRLFKQFTIINRTASICYKHIQGGLDGNFYAYYKEYEGGRFGWIKEARAFECAVEVYENFTSNEAWDILNEIDDTFGEDLLQMTFNEIADWEEILEEIK